MLNVKKKIAGMLCMMIIITLIPAASYAISGDLMQEGGIITPNLVGVISSYTELNFSAGKANPVIDVSVDSSKVDKVNFNGSLLQFKNNQWITIATWNVNKSVKAGHSTFNQSYGISSGYDYKFVTVVKAYKGSALVDTVNIASSAKHY